jgi:hypothetical protein
VFCFLLVRGFAQIVHACLGLARLQSRNWPDVPVKTETALLGKDSPRLAEAKARPIGALSFFLANASEVI